MLNRNGLRAAVAAFILFVCAVGPVSAKYTVINSKVDGFKMGQVIEDGASISLKEGQRITVISSNGKTVTLRGPFDGPVAGSSTGDKADDRKSALMALVATRDARTSSVGVIRAGNDAAALPEPWLIDVGYSSTKCLLDGEKPVWWRADTKAEQTLQVAPSDRSWKAEYKFASGADEIRVGDELPIKPVNVMFLKLDDKEFGIQLLLVPKVISDDPVVMTGWMLEKGCVQQASALIEQIRKNIDESGK